MQAEGRFYWSSQADTVSVFGRSTWLLTRMLELVRLPERRGVKLLP